MGGGSKTTEVKIPEWLEDAGKEALARSRDVSRIPYAAYYGPDVAAMTPMQVAAMRGTNQMAEAFGAPTADLSAGMPTAQDYGGMSAYSAGPMYDAAVSELQRRQPGTYDAIMAQFGSTAGTGGGVGSSASATGYVPTMEPRMPMRGGRDAMPSQGGARSTTSMATPGSYMPGGINTNNPNSLGNRVAAAMSPPQGPPTKSDRPVPRSSASGGGSGGMGGGKG